VERCLKTSSPSQTALDWKNTSFVLGVHLLGIAGIGYLLFVRSSPWTIAFAALWFMLQALSITAGYHRFYAHHTYCCAKGIQRFYLWLGAASFQNSVLRWASDHRRHHAYTDTKLDPYNIKEGFWNAHCFWIFKKGPPSDFKNVKDLARDPLVAFQDRHYALLGICFGILPAALGFLWGDFPGALLVGCGLKLTIQYNATFAVNSFAHWIGTRPYSHETSASNSLLVALITFGEGGGHNRHHDRPGDYRTGERWWSFDPPKWWIWSLSKLRLAWDLKRFS